MVTCCRMFFFLTCTESFNWNVTRISENTPESGIFLYAENSIAISVLSCNLCNSKLFVICRKKIADFKSIRPITTLRRVAGHLGYKVGMTLRKKRFQHTTGSWAQRPKLMTPRKVKFSSKKGSQWSITTIRSKPRMRRC